MLEQAPAEEEDAEEARIRELVFGKGDQTLLGAFGSEGQQDQDPLHQQRRGGEQDRWLGNTSSLSSSLVVQQEEGARHSGGYFECCARWSLFNLLLRTLLYLKRFRFFFRRVISRHHGIIHF